jgi:hypothetical protein
MYLRNASYGYYPAGSFAEFYFPSYGDTYVNRADFGKVKLNAAPSTVMALGIWNYSIGYWQTGGGFSWGQCPGGGGSPFIHGSYDFFTNNGQTGCGYQQHCGLSGCGLSNPGLPNAAVMMLYQNYSDWGGSQLYMGGARVQLHDSNPPSFDQGSLGLPSGWVPETYEGQIDLSARDNGVGIKHFYVDRQGLPTWSSTHPCQGSRLYFCPATWHSDGNYRAWSMSLPIRASELQEGERPIVAKAYDVVGNFSELGQAIRVDKTPPDLLLNGGLGPDEPQVTNSSSSLNVSATDGNSNSPQTYETGVEAMLVEANGAPLDISPYTEGTRRPCTQTGWSCSFSKTYTRPQGWVQFRVQAKDYFGTQGWASHVSPQAPKTWEKLVDDGKPAAPTASTEPADTWVDSENFVADQVSASDPGAGIKRLDLRIGRELRPALYDSRERSCNDTYANRCPNGWELTPTTNPPTFDYSTDDLEEGISQAKFYATDALGRESDPREVRVRVDRSGPQIEFTGGFADRGSEDYDLHVAGIDGTAESAAQNEWSLARSGMKRLRVLVNGEQVYDSEDQACEDEWGSCGIATDIEIDPLELGEGKTTVRAIATDQLGHDTEKEISKTIDFNGPVIVEFESSNLQGWVGDIEAETAITAENPGGGVKRFELDVPGVDPDPLTEPNCGGPNEKDCPEYTGRTFTYPTASIPEGIHEVVGKAFDPRGRVSAPRQHEVKIDRTSPTINEQRFESTTGSTLYAIRRPDADSSPAGLGIPATPGVEYTLDIATADGDNQVPRAGVRSIEVLVDGRQGAFWEQECPQGSCSMERTFRFNASEYGDDDPNTHHLVETVVTDFAGNEVRREFEIDIITAGEVTVPARSAGLEQYFHFDSTETGLSGAHVNLATGNLVWHKTPLTNPGRGLNSFLNLTYNSFDHAPLDTPPAVDSKMLGAGEYDEAGLGFSVGLSGVTRVNEPLRFFDASGNDLPPLVSGAPLVLPASIGMTDADGTVHRFYARVDKPLSFRSPAGVNLHLRKYNNAVNEGGTLPQNRTRSWAMTRPDGVSYFFDALGFLRHVEDRNGNRLDYQYQNIVPSTGATCATVAPGVCEPRLRYVIDAAGAAAPAGSPLKLERAVEFAYYGQNEPLNRRGKIFGIFDHSDRGVLFDYSASGELTKLYEGGFTPEPRMTELRYDPAPTPAHHPQLTQIIDPELQSTTITYDGQGVVNVPNRRVASITNRNQNQRLYSYGGDTLAANAPTTPLSSPTPASRRPRSTSTSETAHIASPIRSIARPDWSGTQTTTFSPTLKP